MTILKLRILQDGRARIKTIDTKKDKVDVLAFGYMIVKYLAMKKTYKIVIEKRR